MGLSLLAVFSACSVNLSRGDLENVPLTSEKFSFFGRIPLVYGGDTLYLDDDLLKAYTAAANEKDYPRETCRGEASILASVKQNGEPTAWSAFLTVIPFWPVMPVDETWNYSMTVRIFCSGTLVSKVEFFEEEEVKAYFYGRLRSGLVNTASAEMHRKLVQRLAFELQMNRQADMNISGDF